MTALTVVISLVADFSRNNFRRHATLALRYFPYWKLGLTLLQRTCEAAVCYFRVRHSISNFFESSFKSSFELLEFLFDEIFVTKFTG